VTAEIKQVKKEFSKSLKEDALRIKQTLGARGGEGEGGTQ